VLGVTVGCDLFTGTRPVDAGPVDVGAVDAFDPSAPWSLAPIARGPHGPGTWLRFVVDGVDVPASELSLWVIEDDLDIPIVARRRVLDDPPVVGVDEEGELDAASPDAGGDAGVGRQRYELAAPLPIVRPGIYHLAIGTADGPRTAPVEVEVVLRAPPLSREEAAAAMAEGLDGLAQDVVSAVRLDDPEWQAVIADQGAAETIDHIDTTVGRLTEASALVREAYMDVPADLEPGVRELLWNAGFLQGLALRASGVSMLTFGGGPLESALARSPLQGMLFTLDVASMLLATFSLVCDVATIVLAALTIEAGGAGGLLGVASKIVCATLRVLIDNIMPTDPTTVVEVQHSILWFHERGTMVVPWVTFEPQNRRLGAMARSFEDLVLIVLAESVPGGGAGLRARLVAVMREIGNQLLVRLSGLGADLLFRPELPAIEVTLPLDLGFYNVTLSQVLTVNPYFIPLSALLSLTYDPEVVSPFSVTAARGGGRVLTDYSLRAVAVTGLAYRSLSLREQIGALVQIRAFAFTSAGPMVGETQIVQLPWPYTLDTQTRFFRVQRGANPEDRSQTTSDEDFIVLDRPVAGGTRRFVTDDSPEARPMVLHLRDQIDFVGPSGVNVLVNGELAYPAVMLMGSRTIPLVLNLRPGLNEIDIQTIAGHEDIRCGPAESDAICITVEFPEADNLNHIAYIYGETGTVRHLRVWTPPIVPRD
jgi:hypothetical protein